MATSPEVKAERLARLKANSSAYVDQAKSQELQAQYDKEAMNYLASQLFNMNSEAKIDESTMTPQQLQEHYNNEAKKHLLGELMTGNINLNNEDGYTVYDGNGVHSNTTPIIPDKTQGQYINGVYVPPAPVGSTVSYGINQNGQTEVEIELPHDESGMSPAMKMYLQMQQQQNSYVPSQPYGQPANYIGGNFFPQYQMQQQPYMGYGYSYGYAYQQPYMGYGYGYGYNYETPEQMQVRIEEEDRQGKLKAESMKVLHRHMKPGYMSNEEWEEYLDQVFGYKTYAERQEEARKRYDAEMKRRQLIADGGRVYDQYGTRKVVAKMVVKSYILDEHGDFVLDENGNKIVCRSNVDNYKYDKETGEYVTVKTREDDRREQYIQDHLFDNFIRAERFAAAVQWAIENRPFKEYETMTMEQLIGPEAKMQELYHRQIELPQQKQLMLRLRCGDLRKSDDQYMRDTFYQSGLVPKNDFSTVGPLCHSWEIAKLAQQLTNPNNEPNVRLATLVTNHMRNRYDEQRAKFIAKVESGNTSETMAMGAKFTGVTVSYPGPVEDAPDLKPDSTGQVISPYTGEPVFSKKDMEILDHPELLAALDAESEYILENELGIPVLHNS